MSRKKEREIRRVERSFIQGPIEVQPIYESRLNRFYHMAPPLFIARAMEALLEVGRLVIAKKFYISPVWRFEKQHHNPKIYASDVGPYGPYIGFKFILNRLIDGEIDVDSDGYPKTITVGAVWSYQKNIIWYDRQEKKIFLQDTSIKTLAKAITTATIYDFKKWRAIEKKENKEEAEKEKEEKMRKKKDNGCPFTLKILKQSLINFPNLISEEKINSLFTMSIVKTNHGRVIAIFNKAADDIWRVYCTKFKKCLPYITNLTEKQIKNMQKEFFAVTKKITVRKLDNFFRNALEIIDSDS